ncbi:MAG TPA: SCO family protein [Caulobacteraceae bacterium]|jgi:protein SCO1/2
MAVAVVVVIAIGVFTLRPQTQGPSASDIGGPFKLVDQQGRPADQRLLDGKWSAVFFGYTFCPDVCPTTLTALGRASDALGAQAQRFQVVFITVDPARDTPKQLATYLSSNTFPKGSIGLTGTPAQIAQAAKAYHVFYQKHPEGGTYTMDHTAIVYLMDPRGRFVKPLDLTAPPADVARQISEAMRTTA